MKFRKFRSEIVAAGLFRYRKGRHVSSGLTVMANLEMGAPFENKS